jgi:D-ornithine 4,5-aminomutase subunit alpha
VGRETGAAKEAARNDDVSETKKAGETGETGETREEYLARRRQEIKGLSDDELKARFWQLAEEIVKPLYELAYTHTSPSIERSVLLRMGFSSLESKAIVSHAEKMRLLGKGAGHLVLRYAKMTGKPYLEAGKDLCVDLEAWDDLKAAFERGPSR